MLMLVYQIFKGNKFPYIGLTSKAHIGKMLQHVTVLLPSIQLLYKHFCTKQEHAYNFFVCL